MLSNNIMQKDTIESSFETTLKDSNLQSVAINISEIGIDAVLNDGLLKVLPVVGTISSFLKFGANIKDRLFLKKILSFLGPLRDIKAEQRKRMIDAIDDSKKYRIKVGEKLLYIIDSCEDYEISELISIAFRYYLNGNITYEEFLKVSSTLKDMNKTDFNWFIKDRESHYFDLNNVGDLISSGLFELYYDQLDVQVRDQDDYKVLRDNPDRKYKTEVDGGGVSVQLSRAGEIILEIFCSTYKKPKKAII
jgi:hypothetical protein